MICNLASKDPTKVCQEEICFSNLKVGLIFVKSKVTDQGVCLSRLSENDVFPSCKCHDKWILVAGNSYSVNLEKDPKVQCLPLSEDDKEDACEPNQNRNSFYKHVGETGSHLHDLHLLQSNIVEMHLDSVFKDKSTKLSVEIFKCVNLRVLSLRNNNLIVLPAEIGRLSQLRTLLLTDNHLTETTIPYTLTFCLCLKELYLDHNLLDALPGFLLEMSQLETVYRHGNHNYFKSTFMWYHTAERDRVMPLRPNRAITKPEGTLYQPLSLESIAIKSLIGANVNFFTPGLLPVTLQEHVAKVYYKYKICGFCKNSFLEAVVAGFRVITFKSPYAGNYCVPFEHWTCTKECGVALEVPAHREERAQSRRQEQDYQQYILGVHEQLDKKPRKKKRIRGCTLM